MTTLSENQREALRDEFVTQIQASSKKLMWTGIALSIIGILALAFPTFSSLSVELTIAWILIFAGAVAFYYSFSFEGAGPFFGALLTSLITLALGIFMLVKPQVGLLSLTVILAGLFFIEGSFKIVLAFEIRKLSGWFWVLLSAIASIILGFMIGAGLPSTALVTVGILVGINFLMTGIALIFLSRSVKAPKVDKPAA